MDYVALKTLIDSEPLNAARNDAEVLAWLNESVSTFKDVEWIDFSMWISEFDLRSQIENAITSGTDAARTAATFFVDTLRAGQPLYSSRADVRTTIAKGIPAGAARDALVALATTSVSRAQAAGFSTPTLGHVERARAL